MDASKEIFVIPLKSIFRKHYVVEIESLSIQVVVRCGSYSGLQRQDSLAEMNDISVSDADQILLVNAWSISVRCD